MPANEPERLLGDVASALNACLEAGIRVRLAHGAAYTSAGYVLPVGLRKTFRAIPLAAAEEMPDPDFDDVLQP